jgi:hypothetical protein
MFCRHFGDWIKGGIPNLILRTRALPIRFRCNCKGVMTAVCFEAYFKFELVIMLVVSTQHSYTGHTADYYYTF